MTPEQQIIVMQRRLRRWLDAPSGDHGDLEPGTLEGLDQHLHY